MTDEMNTTNVLMCIAGIDTAIESVTRELDSLRQWLGTDPARCAAFTSIVPGLEACGSKLAPMLVALIEVQQHLRAHAGEETQCHLKN